ncbi:AAA domain-containing protein [Massilia sp. YIM B02769]|uniref:AAA domain-containing protein n=1 Tax=Massilia sp. YIM B02769 TaxID=3050129 RepID=UPI0025B6F17E|nr:AAA domain-containing protein [Massilia sp. YIM B02769]MDN4058031.1 AAA domain-containing protein [Massilia sp. YIM B02769]
MAEIFTTGLRLLNSRYRLTARVAANKSCETWIARDEDEHPFLMKAWSAVQHDPLLRAVWDQELRMLYRVSSSPGADECLLVIREAQLDSDIGAFVLLAEGPGYDLLSAQIHARSSCEWLKPSAMKQREPRQELWKGFKRIAQAIHALHAQQIIHRNVSADSIFLAATEGPATMRLGAFEWSVRVGATPNTSPDHGWAVPPEVAEGKSGYIFDSDWYGFGTLLARSFLEVEGWRDRSSKELSTLLETELFRTSILTVKERELIRRLLTKKPNERLRFGEEVIRLIVEITRDLAMPVGSENLRSPLQLVVSPTHSSVINAISAHGFRANPEDPSQEYSPRNLAHVAQLKDFIQNDIAEGLLYPSLTRDHCILMGRQVTYRIRQYKDNDASAASWDFAQISQVTSLSIGDQMGQPSSLLGRPLNVLIPRDVMHARGHPKQSWEKIIPYLEEGSKLAKGISKFHDFLRATNQLELLFRDGEICAYELIEHLPAAANFERIALRERTRDRPILPFCKVDGGMVKMLQREFDSGKKNSKQVILSDTDSLLVPGVNTRIDPWTIESIDFDNNIVTLERAKAPDQKPFVLLGYLRTYGQYAQVTLIRRRTGAIERLHEHSYLLRALVQPGMVYMDTAAASLPYMDGVKELDESKLAVIKDVLRVRPIYALQGPPGTGKTTLVAHLLRQILEDDPVAQILVTAPGHSAVDVLRAKVRDEVFGGDLLQERPISVRLRSEKQDGSVPEGSAKQVANDMLTGLAAQLGDLTSRTQVQDEWLELINRLTSMPLNENDQRALSDIEELVKRSASITYCTTSAADLEALADGNQSFDWSIVEEAGKAHGFDLALPLNAGHRWLLLGDQNQLLPYQFKTYLLGIDHLADVAQALSKLPSRELVDMEWIRRWSDYPDSERDEFQNLCKSWLPTFSTLLTQLRDQIHGEPRLTVAESIGASAGRLAVQYRMHPAIGKIISNAFYPDFEGIRNATEDEDGKPTSEVIHDLVYPEGLAGKAICWIDTPWSQRNGDYQECGRDDGRPRYTNPMEARVISAFLESLKPIAQEEIAVLSPYSAQVSILNSDAEIRRIRDARRLRFRQSIREEDDDTREDRVAHTVDSFQGNESDFVIVSLVRNNSDLPGQGLGFLADSNRLNVLLSRAQKLLVLVGSWQFFYEQVSLVNEDNTYDHLWPLHKAIKLIEESFSDGTGIKIKAEDILRK